MNDTNMDVVVIFPAALGGTIHGFIGSFFLMALLIQSSTEEAFLPGVFVSWQPYAVRASVLALVH